MANTALGQLLRLPTLVHHYLEHVEWDNSSLIDFLSEHYQTEIKHPDDAHKDHQNLPFKSFDVQTVQVVTIVPQPTFTFSQKIDEAETVKQLNFYQHTYSNPNLLNIWQPPRFS